MTAIREASTMYASMFSLVLFMILFESRLNPQKTRTLTISLMGPLLAVNCVLLVILGPEKMNTLLLLTCSLPSLIFFWCLAKYRDGRFFFTFCFADTLILEVIDATAIVDYFLGNTYIFTFVSRLILCPVLAFVLWKWVKPMYLEVQHHTKKGWFLFAAIALLFYVILSMSMAVPTIITQRLDQLPAFILLLILMPVIYLHIFTTLRNQRQAHKIEEQDKLLQLQVVNLRSRVEEFTVSAEKVRIERHNFRHQLQTIATLLDNGQYPDARAVIQEYTDIIAEPLLQRWCDHPVIDAVLAFHLRKAKDKHIRISTNLCFPDTLPASEAELATVFANALENAIHACETLDPEKRSLEIIVRSEPCFMFQIRNSYSGIITLDEDEVPISLERGHGFGTRSIVTFCEKNHAYYDFKVDDSFFALRVSFR